MDVVDGAGVGELDGEIVGIGGSVDDGVGEGEDEGVVDGVGVDECARFLIFNPHFTVAVRSSFLRRLRRDRSFSFAMSDR